MSASSKSLKNLSLDRLRNFAEVVRKGGISTATGGDRSRQALISRQIAELSSHFEVELTRRSGRGLAFTPAGEGREAGPDSVEVARGVRAQEAPVSVRQVQGEEVPLVVT